MSEIVDKYYYKFQSLAAEAEYLSRWIKSNPQGLPGLVESEQKRKAIKGFIASAIRELESASSKLGHEFTPEFPDG